ncbi:MAG: ABC transporter permease, partial [Chitinophagaceae bacterium]
LTIGLTSFILISLYIFDELTFDSFHENPEQIYRVIETKVAQDGQKTMRSGTGFQLSERASEAFPEVTRVARMAQFWKPEIRTSENNTNTFQEDYIAASQDFLDIFSFPMINGNKKSALKEPKSVVLTESSAKRYFGSIDVAGRSLYFDNDSVPYTITGVLKDLPVNSSISFNLLVSEATIMQIPEARSHFSSDWNSGAFTSYFKVEKQTAIPALNKKLDMLIAANHKGNAGEKNYVHLQRLTDIHFYSEDIEGNSGKKGNISYIYVFFIVACFIIVVACINYMNLSTARFMNRGKEIAVRKVAGASRATLIRQFLMEVALLTIVSVLFSIILVNLLLPAFNGFTEKHLSFSPYSDYRIWTGIF